MAKTRRERLKQFAILIASAKIALFPRNPRFRSQYDVQRALSNKIKSKKTAGGLAGHHIVRSRVFRGAISMAAKWQELVAGSSNSMPFLTQP
jgi:hypothetical protein